MEIINTEIVISSLFKAGFDKVDSVLFTLTLGKVLLDNVDHYFEFKDCELSYAFNKYFEYNGVVFKIKDGLNIGSNVSEIDKFYRSLGDSLITNYYLVDYLKNLDFSEIILKKANIYEINTIDDIDKEIFCNKEIDILNSLKFNKEKLLYKE